MGPLPRLIIGWILQPHQVLRLRDRVLLAMLAEGACMCPLDYSLPPVYSCEHRFELPFHHFTSSHGRVTVRMNLEASMQVGEMHFFSPSGCSFFGKRRLRTHELVR